MPETCPQCESTTRRNGGWYECTMLNCRWSYYEPPSDPGDSNGCAQDHTDAVATTKPDRWSVDEILNHNRCHGALVAALKESSTYIAELQRKGCERGEVAVPKVITDALKLAEGVGN